MAKTNDLYIAFQNVVSLDFNVTDHRITSGQSFEGVTFSKLDDFSGNLP